MLTIFAALFVSTIGFGQNNANLVIFSEDLEPFFAYVNGVKQNSTAETNVRITNLNPNIALRIEFVNKALPILKQNFMLEQGFEHTARLKYDKNKVMKLRYFGQVPLAEVSADKNTKLIEYHTADDASPAEVNTQTNDAPVNYNTTVTDPMGASVNISSQTVTTSHQSGDPGNQAGSVNVSMPGGVGISMTISDPASSGRVHSSTSTTITSTTTGSLTETRTVTTTNTKPVPPKPVKPAKPVKVAAAPAPTVSAAPVATTKTGCTVAIGNDQFNRIKSNIESKPFSDTKMSVARVATKNACMTVNQIKEITKLFSMDDDKLVYAKFAFDYCVDKANYYEISDAFSFSTTQEDFLKFLDK